MSTYVGRSGWKSHAVGYDWLDAWVKAAVEIGKATIDRCQPGLQPCDEWCKEVVGISGTLISEIQFASGARNRPMTAAQQEEAMETLRSHFAAGDKK